MHGPAIQQQERTHHLHVEQIVDVPAHQLQVETLHVPVIVQQEMVPV